MNKDTATKDTIIALLVLSLLLAVFSVYANQKPSEQSKDGWTVNGTGATVLGDGETAQMDVFAFNAEPTEIEQQSPVSVTMEQPTEEKENPFPWEVFLVGIAAGVQAENIVIVVAVILAVTWKKNK